MIAARGLFYGLSDPGFVVGVLSALIGKVFHADRQLIIQVLIPKVRLLLP